MDPLTVDEYAAGPAACRSDRWTGPCFTIGHAPLVATLLFGYLRGWDLAFTVPLRVSATA